MHKFSTFEPIYTVVDGIKIYDGTTPFSRKVYARKIEDLKTLKNTVSKEHIFSKLQPSTLTAQGCLTNVSFEEKNIIDMLSALKAEDHILMIGCNYGEIFNPRYKKPEVKKNSGRGRKPKPKIKTKRKMQGNGKYFSSQITFLIEHPDSLGQYKIKLFRNGVFQVPGIRNPDMKDLVKPIKILRAYLQYNFGEDVQVDNFTAVMRNYKSRLINQHYHVHLERLEELISSEKKAENYEKYIKYLYSGLSTQYQEQIRTMLGRFNPLNIAEMTYNTDRCFCLIIKFYRPSSADKSKKTTVKLLKKGKINFDGGNSQQEVEELYFWLEYIYNKYKSEILFDIRHIKNEYNSDTSDCDAISIYSDSESDSESGKDSGRDKPDESDKSDKSDKSDNSDKSEEESESEEESPPKKIARKPPMRKTQIAKDKPSIDIINKFKVSKAK
jgi:hypothetical protein